MCKLSAFWHTVCYNHSWSKKQHWARTSHHSFLPLYQIQPKKCIMGSLDMLLPRLSIFQGLLNANWNFNVLDQSLAMICSHCRHVLSDFEENLEKPQSIMGNSEKNWTAPVPYLYSSQNLISVEPPSLTGPILHRQTLYTSKLAKMTLLA